MIVPTDYIGPVMKLRQNAWYKITGMLGAQRAMLTYDILLAEVATTCMTRSRAARVRDPDYEMVTNLPILLLDIIVNGKRDALSVVCNADDRRGRAVAEKLKTEIERHMFEVAVRRHRQSRDCP